MQIYIYIYLYILQILMTYPTWERLHLVTSLNFNSMLAMSLWSFEDAIYFELLHPGNPGRSGKQMAAPAIGASERLSCQTVSLTTYDVI